MPGKKKFPFPPKKDEAAKKGGKPPFPPKKGK